MAVTTDRPEAPPEQRPAERPADDRARDERRPEKPPDDDKPKRSWIREHPIGAVVAAIVVVAILIGVFVWWRYSQTYESTDDAFIDGHISNVSSRVQGTVAAVYAVENQQVVAGQTLVDLDPRDLKVSLDRAKADLAQAQAAVNAQNPNVPITATTTESGIAGARAEVATTQAGVAAAERDRDAQLAQLRQAEANNAKAQADLARYTALVRKDEISREEYDQRVAAAKSAQAAVEAQQSAVAASQKIIDQRNAQVAAANVRLDEVRGTAPQQVLVQRANVQSRQAGAEAARAAVEQAALNLEYAKIAAPVAGIIGRRSVEVGQRIQPGQELLSVVQLDDLWVTANYKETQLRHMRAGMSVTIHVDAFDRDYDGYVESLPAASGARFSVLPPENATGNYVKVVQRLPVRIRFKPNQDPEHRLRPGMSVAPKVWLK